MDFFFFYSARWKMLSFACSHAFYVLQRGRLLCTHLLFSLRRYLTLFSLSLSPVHRQAVSAEAGTMSTPTNPEVKELSPVDFIQLQQYIECEYRQAGGRAGRQLSQRLTSTTTTPPLHFHFHPHTHTHSLMVSHS